MEPTTGPTRPTAWAAGHLRSGGGVPRAAQPLEVAAVFLSAQAEVSVERVVDYARRRVPREIWRQIWPNDPQKRLDKEIRPRTDVVGFPVGCTAVIRLVKAVLAEPIDE